MNENKMFQSVMQLDSKKIFLKILYRGPLALWTKRNRPLWARFVLLLLLLSGGVVVGQGDFDREGTLWEPVLEWSVENPSWSGNPFDLEATATFVHRASGEERVTPLFYDGGDVWKFRFTATRTGAWSLRTRSEDVDLDGKEGTVEIHPNPNPNARGFTVAHGSKFAKQVGEDGTLEAFVPNVYMNIRVYGNPERCGWTAISPTFSNPDVFDFYLDEVEAHGSNTAFALIVNQWFKAGAASSRDHRSENPDPETFRALEQAIQQAHARNMQLHIWAWGDEQRRWTPERVGGVNGVPDRRVQRYIAARLGPLPGWTMSYGFDLNEWADEEEVESWAKYINEHSGWKRLLSARPRRDFTEVDTLPVAANDDRPSRNFYQIALAKLEEASDRPVMFERRFSYLRDDVWDMETTRRAFWQFTLAGGAGSIWGLYPPNCSAYKQGRYPEPHQLRTHREFWENRFLLEMEPAFGLSDDDGTLTLLAEDSHVVFYHEDADEIHLNLSGMEGPQPGVAVDTKGEYKEISLGKLAPGEHVWEAPHRSDWAIAVGEFQSSLKEPLVKVEALSNETHEMNQIPAIFRITRNGSAEDPLRVLFSFRISGANGADQSQFAWSQEIPSGREFIDISVIPNPDDMPNGDATIILTLLRNDAYEIGQAGAASVILRDHPLDHWLFMHFSPDELMDPSVGNLGADPNGDGISNLMTFALGGNPRNPMQTGLPQLEEYEGHLRLVFRRRRDSAVDYRVEVTSDPGGSWQEGPKYVEILVLGPDPTDPESFDVVAAIDRTPAESNARRFMRLRVDRS